MRPKYCLHSTRSDSVGPVAVCFRDDDRIDHILRGQGA